MAMNKKPRLAASACEDESPSMMSMMLKALVMATTHRTEKMTASQSGWMNLMRMSKATSNRAPRNWKKNFHRKSNPAALRSSASPTTIMNPPPAKTARKERRVPDGKWVEKRSRNK